MTIETHQVMSMTRPRILPPSAPQPAMRFADYDQDTLRRAMKAARYRDLGIEAAKAPPPDPEAAAKRQASCDRSRYTSTKAKMALVLTRLLELRGQAYLTQISVHLGIDTRRTGLLLQYLVADGVVVKLQAPSGGFLYRVAQ